MAKQKGTEEPSNRKPNADATQEACSQPPYPTAGQAEGDRQTVEEDLKQKQTRKSSGGSNDV